MNGAAGSGQPLRERVLTALEELWCPLRVNQELRPYLEGTWGDPAAVADWEQDRFSIWGEVADWQFDLVAAEDRRRRQRIARRRSCLATTHRQGDAHGPARRSGPGHGDRAWRWMVSVAMVVGLVGVALVRPATPLTGRVRTVGTWSRSASTTTASLVLAAVTSTDSGSPVASAARCSLGPRLARSTGFAPVWSPPERRAG